MKKIFYLLLLVVLIGCEESNSPDVADDFKQVNIWGVRYDNGIKLDSMLAGIDYYENKLKTHSVYYDYSGNEEVNMYYEYDSNNKLIKRIWDNIDIYEYDYYNLYKYENGLLVLMEEYRENGDKTERIEYYYDENDLLIESKWYIIYKNESDRLIADIKYFYDENNRLIKSEAYTDDDEYFGKTLYYYNKRDNLSKEERYNANDKFNLIIYYEYIY